MSKLFEELAADETIDAAFKKRVMKEIEQRDATIHELATELDRSNRDLERVIDVAPSLREVAEDRNRDLRKIKALEEQLATLKHATSK
jgi:transposase-like protein